MHAWANQVVHYALEKKIRNVWKFVGNLHIKNLMTFQAADYFQATVCVYVCATCVHFATSDVHTSKRR